MQTDLAPMLTERMQVAVIGGGAIGCLFADAARLAGSDVTLCVRTPIARVLIERGGRVRQADLRIATDPDAVAPVDWIFLATKTQDSQGAGAWLDRLRGACSRIVLLQNGIDAADEIRPLTGSTVLIPTVLYTGAERVAPGHVVHYGGDRVEVAQGADGRSFARLMQAGPIGVSLQADFKTAAWRKLMCNIAVNPITALSLSRLSVLNRPGMADLARGLMREAAAVGRCAGAHIAETDIEDILAFCLRQTGCGTSMLYDRLAGNRLEYEHLTGTIVRKARECGVAVPLNTAVLALLGALDEALQTAPFAAAAPAEATRPDGPLN